MPCFQFSGVCTQEGVAESSPSLFDMCCRIQARGSPPWVGSWERVPESEYCHPVPLILRAPHLVMGVEAPATSARLCWGPVAPPAPYGRPSGAPCCGHRCVMDDGWGEVRDRATFYLNVLEQKQKALNAGHILNGESSLAPTTLAPSWAAGLPGGVPSAGLPRQLQGVTVISGGARTPRAEQPRELSAASPTNLPSTPRCVQAPVPCPFAPQQCCRGGCPCGRARGSLAGFLRVLQP